MSSLERHDDLESRWSAVLGAGSGLFNLVDAEHPLRAYIGGNTDGQPTLTIVTAARPPKVPDFDLLRIGYRRRDDGTWLLLIQLTSNSAFHEFVAMSRDLLLASRTAPDEREAAGAFIAALDRWRGLFRQGRNALLSESQMRGLFAELHFMMQFLSPIRQWAEIVTSWDGPLRAPQDFRISGDLSMEVKSIHKDSESVRIASLEQLSTYESSLILVTVVVEAENVNDSEAVTLTELVGRIEGAIGTSLVVLDAFREKLAESGFDATDPAYADFAFVPGQMAFYRVEGHFPRLERPLMHASIARAEYHLLLDGLSDFAIGHAEAAESAIEGGKTWI